MNVHFLGGADEVGASCTLIKIEGQRILVDAGIRMGAASPLPDLDAVGTLDAVLVTHAHTDHTGALPVLVKRLPAGVKMYGTPATKEIAGVLLSDAAKPKQDGKPPLYSPKDVTAALRRMKGVRWQKPVLLCDGVTATWIPAGHILGAAMSYIEGRRESILMTGDVSGVDQLTIPGMVVPEYRPDVMVMESTYGNRNHGARSEQEDKLVSDVAEVIAAGGKVLIPAFAVGRSQEIILILKRAMQRNQILEFPVFVDGMVQKVNAVYSKFGKNLSFYSDSDTIRPVPRDADRDNVSSWEPCCIVASSGMLNGGRSCGYAEHLAGDPANLIAIAGYQAAGTPGCALLDRKPKVKLNGGQHVNVVCKVKRYSLSAHADRDELTELVQSVQPCRLFLVHGDRNARRELAQAVRRTSPSVDVELPEKDDSYFVPDR